MICPTFGFQGYDSLHVSGGQRLAPELIFLSLTIQPVTPLTFEKCGEEQLLIFSTNLVAKSKRKSKKICSRATLDLFHSEYRVFCAVAYLVEALCYKPESRGFESRLRGLIFNLPNPSSRTMALGSTRPLI
jgi:hypothetical protein